MSKNHFSNNESAKNNCQTLKY